MTVFLRWSGALLLVGAALAVACGASAPKEAGASGAAATGSSGARLDMDKIFPPGEGRELILQNCTNCHTFVPIALARNAPNEWRSQRTQHRQRVPGLTDAQVDIMYGYLIKNNAPGRPLPELPEDLLRTWTSY